MDHQQARSYNWMWTPTPTKRKLEFSAYDSWEEQAFAEDAAGLLGSSGCVWPPRSYTCSFCRREFRSAQALGGHMNVHRRDRARLKQLPNTPQDHQTLIPPFNNETHSSPFLKDGLNYKTCPSNPNPNNPHSLVGHSKTMQSCNLSSPSSSNHNYHQKTHEGLANPNPNYAKRDAKIIEVVECREDAKSELSISLSLVVRRNLPEDEDSCIKRRKIVTSSPEESPPLIFSSEGNNGVDHKINIVPTNHSSSSREIDLELRLGV